MNYLTQDEITGLVQWHIREDVNATSTQEILNSGAVPRLKGYIVRPGKVSDSIYGGRVSFTDKKGNLIEAENPPLETVDGTPIRIMIRTTRISTHDINRGEIPFKDQILALNHNFMRRLLAPYIGTSQIDVPGNEDYSVVIAAENLTQIPFENVIRAYMAKSTTSTSLFVHYMNGERNFAGHVLPEGLISNGKLPYVMDTPSTKSDLHDETLAPSKMFELGITTPEIYNNIRNSSLVAFGVASGFLANKGIILVDTKLEHGINKNGQIVSQDEIMTLDSSRFWLMHDYAEQISRLNSGKIHELNPKSYSKEFARGFSIGDKGYTQEQIMQISLRYIEGIQHLLGQRFRPIMNPRDQRVIQGLENIVKIIN